MAQDVLTLTDIARLTGKSYDWLTRPANRRKLYAKGFPKPLPLPGHPVWHGPSVTGWLSGHFGPAGANDSARDTPPPPADKIDQHRSALDRRLSA